MYKNVNFTKVLDWTSAIYDIKIVLVVYLTFHINIYIDINTNIDININDY